MAYDKLVDSALLDGAMAATAGAIRAKTGGSSQIPWDQGTGFAAAIQEIPEGIPIYVRHYTLTPDENIRSVQIPVGDGIHLMVITSTYPLYAPSGGGYAVAAGIVCLTAAGTPYQQTSRLACVNASGNPDYYASSSGGGQSWQYQDGVMTLANTSGWFFKAGVQYDFYAF